MEQATNLFTKGLQMDTHPMVQGNDTLTDCLNGTLITMNGDEVILQNDMGNRRVDLAFLPAGYEPVGIKEYGGIIYIAAYNPITNQSQIGSFPSPLRNYNNVGKELSISLSYGNDTDLFKVKEEFGINYLINDSYLKLLIDKPLIPGDKFLTVYNEWNNNITLDEDDPRKLFSVYYGILNSQNLFVDISNTLIRQSVSTGHHFLASSAPSSGWNSLDITIATQALEESRLSYDMNTYSGKLVGYPYIKVQLNHPVNFTYSYTGFRINDSTILLDIVGKLDYNCPNPNYNNDKTKYGFSLYVSVLHESDNNGDPNISNDTYIEPTEIKINESITNDINNDADIKDEVTNLYSKIIKKTYLFKSYLSNGITYTPSSLAGNILIPVLIDDPNEIYLNDLSVSMGLDFSLFGSNRLILTSWGFKKDGDDIILRYNIDNYFSNTITYSDLKLTLTDITTTSDSINILLDGIGGTIRISGLTDRHIYTAKISHKIKDLDGNYIEEGNSAKILYVENTFKVGSNTIEDRLWILNTHLFDECYSSGSKYIGNYCNRTQHEQEIFDKLTEINIYVDGDLTEVPSTTVESHTAGTGYVECSVENDISFKITNTISKQFNTSGLNIKTENENLYPNNINSEFLNKNYLLELVNTLTNVKDIGGTYYFGNLPNYLEQYLNITSEINNIDNNTERITITYPDFFYGQATSKTYIDDVPFVFHKIDDEVINNWSYSNQGALDFRISEYPLSLKLLPNNRIVLFSEEIGDNNIAAINLFTDLDHPVDIHGVDLHNVAITRNEGYLKELLVNGNNQLDLTSDNVIQHPTKYSFMYKEDNLDSLVVEAKIANFGGKATYDLKHSQMEVHKSSGTPIVAKYNGFNESRNEGEKKCLIYTKSCQIGSNVTTSDPQNTYDFLNTPIDNVNSSLCWGIIPGMVNLLDNTLSRKNVISKIKSLFDSLSRMCVRSKERIGVYTVKGASENSTSYYSRIINFNYKQNININGSITNTQIDFTTNWEPNEKLSFKVNNTCNNLYEVTFVLNSYDDYILKLNTEYPHINPYLDLSTGKYINDTRFGNFQLTQHFVYVPNLNGGFRPVNNVLMLYCDALKDYFGPVFNKDTSNDDYRKLVSYIQVNDNVNEFIVDLDKFGSYRPYPIEQLT